MAAARTRIFLFAFCASLCTFAQCEDTLHIAYSPSYVQFQKDAGAIDVTEIPDVISLALGFSSEKELKWSGLSIGDLFRRPKANVLITIETTDNSLSLDIGSNNVNYPLEGNGEVDLKTLRGRITSLYGEDKPLILDLPQDVKGVEVSKEYRKLFEKLPVTLTGVLPLLHGAGSIVRSSRLGSLNLTNQADTVLLSELQLLREIVNQLRENPSAVTDNIPDSYVLTLSGLRSVQSKYGADSAQAQDATSLLSSFVSQFTDEVVKLYGGDAVVEVVTSHEEPLVNRRSRSLLQSAEAPSAVPKISNRAPSYSADYPVIFNIILWMAIGLIIAVYVIAYGLWNLDPGDTIIYRMTNQRMKMD